MVYRYTGSGHVVTIVEFVPPTDKTSVADETVGDAGDECFTSSGFQDSLVGRAGICRRRTCGEAVTVKKVTS